MNALRKTEGEGEKSHKVHCSEIQKHNQEKIATPANHTGGKGREKGREGDEEAKQDGGLGGGVQGGALP